jgi:hypothetical protein
VHEPGGQLVHKTLGHKLYEMYLANRVQRQMAPDTKWESLHDRTKGMWEDFAAEIELEGIYEGK